MTEAEAEAAVAAALAAREAASAALRAADEALTAARIEADASLPRAVVRGRDGDREVIVTHRTATGVWTRAVGSRGHLDRWKMTRWGWRPYQLQSGDPPTLILPEVSGG